MLILAPLLSTGCGGGDAPPAGPPVLQPLPVRYLADRFAVAPVTTHGDTLELYTDTGGGLDMMWAPTVRRLGLVSERVSLDGDPTQVVSLPAFAPAAGIPLPRAPEPLGTRLAVMPLDSTAPSRDGFLGRYWFRDRVWVFDYPGQALGLLSHSPAVPVSKAHRVELGFRRSRMGFGPRTSGFARIRVEIDGDSLDLLLDTGAMVTLTDSAIAKFAALGVPGPRQRGASFIARSVFERWRGKHPDWRVVTGADGASPMIEVPSVGVGGFTSGPVWFALRADANFHQYMSQWMDRRIEGALGGSALKYFRVTVDYPRATADFERPAH